MPNRKTPTIIRAIATAVLVCFVVTNTGYAIDTHLAPSLEGNRGEVQEVVEFMQARYEDHSDETTSTTIDGFIQSRVQAGEVTALSELQITACTTADEAGTCDTRLPELGIVLKENCCKALGKCC